jgi:hypothetical protein
MNAEEQQIPHGLKAVRDDNSTATGSAVPQFRIHAVTHL